MKVIFIIATLFISSVSFATETQTDCSAINNAREVGSKVKDVSTTIKSGSKSH